EDPERLPRELVRGSGGERRLRRRHPPRRKGREALRRCGGKRAQAVEERKERHSTELQQLARGWGGEAATRGGRWLLAASARHGRPQPPAAACRHLRLDLRPEAPPGAFGFQPPLRYSDPCRLYCSDGAYRTVNGRGCLIQGSSRRVRGVIQNGSGPGKSPH